MELVIKHGEEYATTSQIIAANTNNEHASTMKLVRDYIGHLEQFGGVRFEIDTFETAGGKQKREIAILNEQQATFLLTLMRNSEIVVRFKVELVKEFYRLRNQSPVVQFAIPQTFAEALRLAADATEQKERYAAQLAIAAPKIEAFSRIAEADGSLGLQAAGKALQQKPNKFIAWLREQGWIYRRAGSTVNLGRAEKVNAGYLTHKVTTVEREDGTEKVVEQVLITPKGLTKLSIMFNVQEAA